LHLKRALAYIILPSPVALIEKAEEGTGAGK
jgi:hypothetical protein